MLKSTLEEVTVLKNYELAGGNYFMAVQSPLIKAGMITPQIGQFYMLKLRNQATLLRRPISISYVDQSQGIIEFLYKKVGQGTTELTHLVPGSTINIQGPLGHGFEIKQEYKNIVIVGAGIGLAPFKFLIEALLQDDSSRTIIFIAGARDQDNLQMISTFNLNYPQLTVITCTDDGSIGIKGNVVTVLQQYLEAQVTNCNCQSAVSNQPDVVYSCGPEIVLKLITKLTNSYHIESQVSLEERMACGVGACVGCSIETAYGMKKVCKDGPVMYSAELNVSATDIA